MGEPLVKSSLYETDYYAWTMEQAALLRAGRFVDVDLDNLVEEIETLGRSELSALRSSLRLVAMHLLKVIHQPDKVTTSWRVTIVRERINAERTLKDNPGLKSKLHNLFAQAYADARKLAAAETGLPIDTFPAKPSFTVEQARDETWVPGPLGTIRPDAADRGGETEPS